MWTSFCQGHARHIHQRSRQGSQTHIQQTLCRGTSRIGHSPLLGLSPQRRQFRTRRSAKALSVLWCRAVRQSDTSIRSPLGHRQIPSSSHMLSYGYWHSGACPSTGSGAHPAAWPWMVSRKEGQRDFNGPLRFTTRLDVPKLMLFVHLLRTGM